ncbi:hypothetical protein EPN16_05540 [bacterium]|nr:MAG: hypothetical protein EPN16_05540 [bacterium]
MNLSSKGLLWGLVLFFGLAAAHADTSLPEGQASWKRVAIDANILDARAIAVDKNNSGVIYAGFKDGLYRAAGAGESWKLLAPGLITKINYICLDAQGAGIVYAATEDGLFESRDAGENWQKIFLGKDALERNVRAIALSYSSPKAIFIGTGSGIFFSPVSQIAWQKVSGKMLDASVLSIVAHPDNSDTLLAATSKGLFRSENRMAQYEKVLSGFNLESEDASVDVDSEEEEITPENYFLRCLAFDTQDSSRVYLGSSEGLLVSLDGGKNWRRQISSGLIEEKINFIVADDKAYGLYLATENGVFACQGDSCRQFYQGADFKACRQLALERGEGILLAADRGVFRISPEEAQAAAGNRREINNGLFAGEPAIAQIQKEAIKYAEVYPEKIAQWRKQARLKAFMPELSLDYDKTVTTALGATYDRVQVGPQDWGLSLKWDLADVVFSTEQTSIDVRSRLMVQLRDDILNEVTRLYFERRRLQLELSRAQNLNENSRVEKELRLEELTALIDGLTNGYLSRSLAKQG